jgi:hypothetical protein
MSEEEKGAINFLKELKKLQIVLTCSFWNKGEFEFNTLQKKQFDIILNLIDKKDKVIEEATNYIENHKTPLGNYLMSPSEIEVLLEILRK